MIRQDYHVNTITWEKHSSGAYGIDYIEPTTINEVYFEKSIILKRGASDTVVSDSWLSIFQDYDIKQGDRITLDDKKYIAIEITRYKKPRSTTFEHIEVTLKEVNLGS